MEKEKPCCENYNLSEWFKLDKRERDFREYKRNCIHYTCYFCGKEFFHPLGEKTRMLQQTAVRCTCGTINIWAL